MAGNSRKQSSSETLKTGNTIVNAKDQLQSVGNVDTGDTFDKAWERVYGSKEYRPSWIGKLETGKGGRRQLPPPPKALESSKPKPKQINKEPKPVTPTLKPTSEHSNGIPDQFRAKNIPTPLTIDGKNVPEEKELEKWRRDIESDEVDEKGKPVYNKVVKKTNVKGWLNNNSYWQPTVQNTKVVPPPKPKKRERILPPKNQKINKSKYDLVGKFENTVKNPDLKLGALEIPKEPELTSWGHDLDIPDDALEADYTRSKEPDDKTQNKKRDRGIGAQVRASHPQPSNRNQKWNAVLQTADVPSFFTKNTFWES